MIVRIMGEGQFTLDDECVSRLNAIDAELDADLRGGDTTAFAGHLQAMHALVRAEGKPLPIEELAPSDAVLPPPGIALDELRTLLGEEGLVPG